MQVLQLVISGVAQGCIYGLIALGFVLIYKATETVSFAQGELMMLGAFFMGDWLGRHMQVPLLAMADGMLLWSAVIAVVAWTAVQRHGRPVELKAV